MPCGDIHNADHRMLLVSMLQLMHSFMMHSNMRHKLVLSKAKPIGALHTLTSDSH